MKADRKRLLLRLVFEAIELAEALHCEHEELSRLYRELWNVEVL